MISDPIPFLANIILVAHADGQLSPDELGHLELIRESMRFKKGDYNNALKLVSSGEHKLIPVGTFADRVKNVELMLQLAYSDDDLDEREEALVTEFAERIGLTQAQLDSISDEVLRSVQQHGKMCPSCGSQAASDAKFCPSCGKSLQLDEDVVKLEFNIPQQGIAIEFADSTAASFQKALAIAKSSESYQTCQKGKKTWHMASYSESPLMAAMPLAEALSGIRNKAVYQDGAEKNWDDVFGFAWCAARRNTAFRPNEYCFGKDDGRVNPWGCKQADMDWTEWAKWFSYGSWTKSGLIGSKQVWKFDKERIRHELSANLFRYRFCPHMIPGFADAVVRHLPETVSPEKDPNWSYSRSYEQVPGSIKVIEKEKSDGYTFTDEFWSDGVRPRGLKVLSDVMQKAATEVQRAK